MDGVEPVKLMPVRSAKSTVKRAAVLLVVVAIATFGVAYWVTLWAFVLWPLVMILAIAVVFATPLLKSGPPVLIIDEGGIYDARILKQPIPWAEIARIEERDIKNPVTDTVIETVFVIEVPQPETWMKHRPMHPARILAALTRLDGAVISAAGLDYSTQGLRTCFQQARELGLLRS